MSFRKDAENVEELSDCVLRNIRKYKKLTKQELDKLHELPCGCEKVALKDLLSDYACPECGEIYFYSFCAKEVVYENDTWHCVPCGTCRESSEWHCKRCNDCTYGLTLSCDGCGKKSPYVG